eukprot:m.14448 g.14448  ORF g.14448 m.14448 type:complete len:215 (-) comp10284_c0_seq1:57-701(-)
MMVMLSEYRQLGPLAQVSAAVVVAALGYRIITTLSRKLSSSNLPTVDLVHSSKQHTFSKEIQDQLKLIAGVGIIDDCHSGSTVQHRSRVARDPSQPNLRQVHLIDSALLEEVDVKPGALGENITTRNFDLLSCSPGTTLCIGDVVLAVTGLRNPCQQIEAFQTGLLQRVLRTRDDGSLERRAGIMAVVIRGGTIVPGDVIRVAHPAIRVPMEKV